MRSPLLTFGKAGGCALLALAGACSAKPLQADAGGGSGGTGTISVDGGQDQFGPIDAPPIDVLLPPPDATFDIIPPPDVRPDVPPPPDGGPDAIGPFTGRRSFVVMSLIQPLQDAGVPNIPSSHNFTLILDGDQGLAI